MRRAAIAVALGALVVGSVVLVFANTAHAVNFFAVGESGDREASGSAGIPGSQAPSRFADSPTAGCIVTNRVIHPDAHATFSVSGQHCVLSLVSYELHGTGLSGQTLYDATTATLGTGDHELSVQVPACRWQVDLALGQPRTPPSYGQNLLAFRFGGEGTCPTSSTTTTTTSTTSPTTTTSVPGSPTSTSTSTTANPPTASTTIAGTGTPSTPTDLATSGGEWGLLAVLALGLIGAGRVVEWRGKKRRRR